MAGDIFKAINNAVLDLQMATMQSYERPLVQLGQLLSHPDLTRFDEQLVATVDLDCFLAESERTGGSMIGSHKLVWPVDRKQQLGTMLLLIRHLAERPDSLSDFCHQYFYEGRSLSASIRAFTSQLLIPFVRDYATFVRGLGETTLRVTMPPSNRVFVVHGHDEGARELVARFIERLGLDAVILHERANRGMTIIEKIEANSDVGFAVVLLTADDVGGQRDGTMNPRARQNVLLELGYFLGKLGRGRVCALKRNEVEIPSDFAGVVWEQLDDGGGWRQRLVQELVAVGYDVDIRRAMAGH